MDEKELKAPENDVIKALNLHDTIDAKIWTLAFMKSIKEHPSIATDPMTMVGWFANAIMAGFDEAKRRDQSLLSEKEKELEEKEKEIEELKNLA